MSIAALASIQVTGWLTTCIHADQCLFIILNLKTEALIV